MPSRASNIQARRANNREARRFGKTELLKVRGTPISGTKNPAMNARTRRRKVRRYAERPEDFPGFGNTLLPFEQDFVVARQQELRREEEQQAELVQKRHKKESPQKKKTSWEYAR